MRSGVVGEARILGELRRAERLERRAASCVWLAPPTTIQPSEASNAW